MSELLVDIYGWLIVVLIVFNILIYRIREWYVKRTMYLCAIERRLNHTWRYMQNHIIIGVDPSGYGDTVESVIMYVGGDGRLRFFRNEV